MEEFGNNSSQKKKSDGSQGLMKAKFGGVRKLIQRAIILYFTKNFQFQCLLGQNRP
jgi:hypothetical protein